ncbi:MAG: hypothetical protein QM572_09100 [Nocardioides sp.]|uniref:hypothetical protein n=1 Tax=Nocardioides sp. TaxID=35761 RepID=UPI0039E48E8D
MRWLARGGIALVLVAALGLGRWIEEAWPSGNLDVRSFERAGEVGHRVSLRYADVRVETVTATTMVASQLYASTTTGVWLVVDATLWAKHEVYDADYWRIVDARGRVFEVDARSGYALGQATPKVPWHVRIAFELPKGDLPGATLRISRSDADERRDDVAVIDLGIDRDRAAELEAMTDPIVVRTSSSFDQPPLPGQPGYDDLFGAGGDS